MALKKVKIGSFVEPYSEACGIPDLTVYDVSGVNKDKEFFEPSKQVGADTSKYKIVPPNYFACNLMHVGRDVVLPIALNHTGNNKIVSPAYTVFRVTDETIILKEYFFMLLKSDERDRYFWFHTDSSVRDGLEWDVFCNLEIEIPEVPLQKKYVDIHCGLQENYNAMSKSIDQMERTYSIYMENLVQTMPKEEIGTYIQTIDNKNDNLKLGMDSVRGISNTKEIMPTKADVDEGVIDKFYIIEPKEFIYNPRTTRMGDKVGLAYNNTDSPLLFTFNNTAFALKPGAEKKILADYLYMFFRRSEFDRFARVNSWGSATELFLFDDLGRYKIPIPDTRIQQRIVDIFNALYRRKRIIERLERILQHACPILIRGSIKEGSQ